MGKEAYATQTTKAKKDEEVSGLLFSEDQSQPDGNW